MANTPKPWKVEYAKSSRSSCKTCKTLIDKEKLRLWKMDKATQFDRFKPMWNHAECILKKANQIKSLEDVEGIDLLRWEDQQKIRKYIEGGASSNTTNNAVNECGVEVSQTSRATCRCCNQKIIKGEVRMSSKPDGQGTKGLQWYHANCLIESSSSTQGEKLLGWDCLSVSDQQAACALAKMGVSTAERVAKDEAKKDEELLQPSSKGGTKRKKGISGDQKSKIPKAGGNVFVSTVPTEKNTNELGNQNSNASDLESKLEAQTKELWAIKDDLIKHVTTAELREMLEANGQDSAGLEFDLRDRCVDGMLFGALGSCPICSGSLRYFGGKYHCNGYLSARSRCSYLTTEPERLKRKWKIPEETNNQYLCKWFKSQKGKKRVRILPPPSSNKASGSQSVNGLSQPSKGERLEDLKVAIAGLRKESMEQWKSKIEGTGVLIHAKIKKDTNCLVVSGELDDQDPEIRKARRMKLPLVRKDYLVDCVKRLERLPFDQYKIEAVVEASRSMVTSKVKGPSAVHESSGLQDSGHILEDGKSINNSTLNMSDLSTGINRLTDPPIGTHPLGDTPIADTINGPSSSSRKRGPTKRKDLTSDGKKKVLMTNEFGQPNDGSVDLTTLITSIGVLTRAHIPIIYKDFRKVPLDKIQKVISTLAEAYDVSVFGPEYLRNQINIAWKTFKSTLHVKYIKNKDPTTAKEGPVPTHVPADDWRQFVDHCTSNEFKVASTRNATNRAKLTAPSTLGRRSMAVIRHQMAVEKNLKSDSEVGRAEVFIRAHTKKDKTVQCPAIVDKIKDVASLNPNFRLTSIDDALTQAIGKDSRGRMRGLGGGISRTVMKKIGPILKKNGGLQNEKNEMFKEIADLREEFQRMNANLDKINAFMAMSQGVTNIPTPRPVIPSSQASSPDKLHIGKQCVMKGWPSQIVARGEVQEVNPMLIVHGSPMGEGNFKILLIEVVESGALLWKPDGFYTTIGEVGVGGFVVWPRIFIEMQC